MGSAGRAGNKIGGLNPAADIVDFEKELQVSDSRPSGLSAWSVLGNWYLWFAEPGANLLGRMRLADNAVAHLAIPTVNSAPQDVAWEGGIPWLTEMSGNKIATFGFGTTSLWTEVPVSTPNSEPYGITLQGSDAVWFTERAGNRLGRYQVSTGALVEYGLPTPGGEPTDVAVDADGCAWYTAPGANRIGRLCPWALEQTYLPLLLH